MVSFRRWITVLAVLSLFTGLGLAQIQVGPVSTTSAGALQCTASVAAPPTLRAEGMTDMIGDIVITCTGGGLPFAGASAGNGVALPTVNFTVSLGTNVTSRLLGNAGAFSGQPSNTSEALLMIDEPGSTLPGPATGFGPTAPQILCTNSATGAQGGCPQYAGTDAAGNIVMTSSNSASAVSCAAGASTYSSSSGCAANVYAGLVSGNQVTFEGIPVLPPTTSGIARVYRITNVRANISGLSAGLAGTTPLTASVSISNYLPVNNPVQTAGFIQAGLSTAVRNAGNSGGLGAAARTLQQCNTNGFAGDSGSSAPHRLATLRFSKNFGTAFKVRYQSAMQNIPGTIYQSESGFILPAATGSSIAGSTVAGQADYGTRLKAVFNNVPTGVRIFVSQANIGGSATAAPYAQLVTSETAPDSGLTPPLVTATTSSGGINIAEVPVVNGTAVAVWEVTQTNPAALENMDFGLYELFTSNPGNNSPPVGTGTVNLSYAPTPSQGAFTTAAGTAASSSLTVPRFADTSTAANFITIAICQTDLLFPFVTNQAGFDTGIAIANTTTDPFGTGAQSGSCTLNWYQGASNPAATDTGSIASGTVYTTLASTAAPGFQGYMIAVCNFQFAHGFAFISDLGARNLAMGYLADVIGSNTDGSNPRGYPAAEFSGQ